jgi:hypothetical protein
MAGGFWRGPWEEAGPTPDAELRVLRAQAEAMREQLDAVYRRIDELEAGDEGD